VSSLLGAIIVFATFVVRENLLDRLKEQRDSISNAINLYKVLEHIHDTWILAQLTNTDLSFVGYKGVVFTRIKEESEIESENTGIEYRIGILRDLFKELPYNESLDSHLWALSREVKSEGRDLGKVGGADEKRATHAGTHPAYALQRVSHSGSRYALPERTEAGSGKAVLQNRDKQTKDRHPRQRSSTCRRLY
jgi:hypothetical protein